MPKFMSVQELLIYLRKMAQDKEINSLEVIKSANGTLDLIGNACGLEISPHKRGIRYCSCCLSDIPISRKIEWRLLKNIKNICHYCEWIATSDENMETVTQCKTCGNVVCRGCGAIMETEENEF